jgi:hypothetical protein
MTARRCFQGKMDSGTVDRRAGTQILDMLDRFEKEYQATLGDAAGARQAALDAAKISKAMALQKIDDVNDAIITQASILRGTNSWGQAHGQLAGTKGDWGWGNKAPVRLGRQDKPTIGFALGSFLARDPYEIATWTNVEQIATMVRGEAHRRFVDGIEFLRAKGLGFKVESTRELAVLNALYERSGVPQAASQVAKAWTDTAKYLADQYRAVGGRLGELEEWRLPNPPWDPNKVRGRGYDRVADLVRKNVDRDKMIDWATGERMNDARFEELLHDSIERAFAGYTGEPSGAYRGSRMLANSRDAHRVFVWKSPESWMEIARELGTFESPYEAMMQHISGMANDIAMMRMLGRNPESAKRFMLGLIDKEAGRLAETAPPGASAAEIKAVERRNASREGDLANERKRFENIWAEVSGENRIPVNLAKAERWANVRYWMSSVQLGSALISSWGDLATVAITARINGLPIMPIIGRAVQLIGDVKNADIFAAQMGLTFDSLAHAAGIQDKLIGESVRSGLAAKLANANIRVSGLRRWSHMLRTAFATEMSAELARARGAAWGELDEILRERFARYGIGEGDWKLIAAATPWEPRPKATFLRPADVLEGGTAAHTVAAEKLAHMMNNEMNYALMDRDAFTRAMLLGDTRPGTTRGELWRSATQYRSYPASVVTFHMARAVARGWDGSRLGHGAATFVGMTLFGAMAMQAKEIAQGRDPLSLDPTDRKGLLSWGKAIMQGGGLGVFGDMLFIDQTRYGNTWAGTFAGPLAGAVERIAGDWALRNIQLAAKGKETHWLGDAAYTAASFVPGSSLWFSRLAFQRGVMDQLALWTDPRARDHFRRLEETARREFGQRYWWKPGRTEPERPPALEAIFPGR